MALQKSFTNLSGNTGDFWRVDAINMSRQDMKMECRLNLYKSKADRNGGKRRMDEQKILNLDIPSGLAQLISGIYSDAKTTITSDQQIGDTPFFDGAIDA